MPDRTNDHELLVSYLLGELAEGERRGFESHLAGCAMCSAEAGELGGVAAKLDQMSPLLPPPDLRAGVLAAVEAAATGEPSAGPEPSRNGAGPARLAASEPPEPVAATQPEGVAVEVPPRREPAPRRERRRWGGWGLPLGFAAALAAAAVAVVIVVNTDGAAVAPVGVVEIEGPLSGESTGELVVSMLGTGREIDLSSPDFPILPKGEAYEVWFVGEGDSAGDPNRISAGTFHPDEDGNTEVMLHAAVDPAIYPLVEVTAEPTGGDPAVEGKVVAMLDGSDQIAP